MKNWSYRVVLKQKKYGFHPVYTDDNGDIFRIGDEPERIFADSIEQLKEEFKLIKEALQQPVINWSNLEEI